MGRSSSGRVVWGSIASRVAVWSGSLGTTVALLLLLGVVTPAHARRGDEAPEPSRLSTQATRLARAQAREAMALDPGLPLRDAERLREEWGVEVVGLRITGAGHMIDFRYRVVDAEKAAALHGPASDPKLIDLATGRKLAVPRPPKLGPLRSNVVMFANMGGILEAGAEVAIDLGGLRIDRIRIQ